MGVTGLWKLIEASGKPVPLETLEGKVLAIDISLWLHQCVKGYQDNKGGYLPNAHLLGLFSRVCKLLYFRIKPIFVFDGGCPELKRQTIAKRAQSKSKIQSEAERLEQLLLETLAKEKIVKNALGDPEKLNVSPSKMAKIAKVEERDDMFKLPPLKNENELRVIKSEFDEDDDEDESCPKRSYDVNINKIDVNSAEFLALPADIRHDILTDIKETRKQNSWGRLRELPVQSNDFSTYQMSRLLRRRQVQVGLEQAEQEMGGKTWSLNELEALLSEDGVLEVDEKHCNKIASNEHTRFMMVRDIAKAMKEAKDEKEAGSSTTSVPQPLSSTILIEPSEKEFDDEDLELQRAIQLSLGNDPDVQTCSSEKALEEVRPRLNPQQRQTFAGTIQAHGLIRGFMMEYAEMNDADIKDLIEETQRESLCEVPDELTSKFPNTDAYILYGTPKKKSTKSPAANEIGVISDSDDEETLTSFTCIDGSESKSSDKLMITVQPNLQNFNQDDDLFADVFDSLKESVELLPDQKDKLVVNFESIPDVEVASISSDEDTLPYEISQNDLEEIHKDSESVLVSEEVHELPTENHIEAVSENDKFWSAVEKVKESLVELSESKKFWAENATESEDEVIEIRDGNPLTPLKKVREKSPPPAKLASPFFVNRKTLSSKKKSEELASQAIVNSAVTKLLFSEYEDIEANFQRASRELRDKKSDVELECMRNQLADDQVNLAQERNKLNRMGMNITETMSRECKDLLKLFGIPYVDSPMEAEAQCAFFNMINLTDGTISDDSDIWLFGGKTVYKNFFVQKKIVMEFRSENIEQMYHLDRKKLIQLAMLVGSDYTVGVNGVGAVTALEILATFPPTSETELGTDQYQSIVSSLRKFREWFQNGKNVGPNGKTILKSKLKNVELFEGFPNIHIARAYLEPTVDTNAEKFSWGSPDSESLVEYAKSKLGWTRLKTEEILGPVMKRLNEKKQATIKDYFKSQVSKKFFDNKTMSKRIQKAVEKMSGVQEPEKEATKPIRKRKAPAKKTDTQKKTPTDNENLDDLILLSSDEEPPTKSSSPKVEKLEPEPSTSNCIRNFSQTGSDPKAVSRKRKHKDRSEETPLPLPPKQPPRIPDTMQVIPQREKDKEKQQLSKQKAIDIFKKSKKSGITK